MGSLLQRFSTIYNEFQNYSSEHELLNHAFILYFHISNTITDSYMKTAADGIHDFNLAMRGFHIYKKIKGQDSAKRATEYSCKDNHQSCIKC